MPMYIFCRCLKCSEIVQQLYEEHIEQLERDHMRAKPEDQIVVLCNKCTFEEKAEAARN